MAQQLNPAGGPVRVGRFSLRTPGLKGVATFHPPGAAGMRSAEQFDAELEQAFAHHGLESRGTVEIKQPQETHGAPPAGMRSTRFGEPAVELTVPAPADGWEQIVLMKDESGVMTWNFADAEDGAAAPASRAPGTQTFTLRRKVAPAEGDGAERGLGSAIGKKVLKVVAFKVLDAVLGEVGDYFAGKWEERYRPYALRSFTPDDCALPAGRAIGSEDWDRFGRGRSLLILHGTFSRAHARIGTLPRESVARLEAAYEGRVFALDHYTLSHDPVENAEWLVGRMPDSAKLEIDVLAHSRGGLVARTLAELQSEVNLGSRTLELGTVVFAATPSNGTVLADADHFGDLIDTFTNLLTFFPDNGVTETVEAIITVAKMIAVGAAKGLDGLGSMVTGGEFLKRLNGAEPGTAEYRAVGADYEPENAGLKLWARDRLVDPIFSGKENDLIVPTASVWEENGSGAFPIAERELYAAGSGIHHSGFFTHDGAREKILGWLGA